MKFVSLGSESYASERSTTDSFKVRVVEFKVLLNLKTFFYFNALR